MEKSKIDMFLGLNAENFHHKDLDVLRERLEPLDDDKYFFLAGIELQKPSMILLIAILLGWERFWLEDVGLGILKILTCYGCGIWWLVDIFSAKDRAKSYNFNKITKTLLYT